MKRNFAFTFVSIGSRLLVGFLLFVFLARVWGPSQFGLFAFAFSFNALLVLLVDFGFHVYLLREVAAEPARAADLISDAFRAKLVLALVAAAIGAILVFAIGTTTLPPLLVAPLFFAALAASFSDFFIAPLRALGHFDHEAKVVILANIAQFTLAGLAAWGGGGVAVVAWAMLASRGIYLCLAYRRMHEAVPQLNLRRSRARAPASTLRRVWTYGVEGLLVTAWSQLDVVTVRAFFGTEAVGAYSAGQRIVVGVYALAPVVGNVMIPRLSKLAIKPEAAFWRTAMITVASMSLIGLFFASPLLIFPKEIVELLFGQSFHELKSIMPLFGVILFARYIIGGTGVAIVAAGLNRARIIAPLFGLSTVAALLPLIPKFNLHIAHFLSIYIFGLFVMGASYIWWLKNFHMSHRTLAL